MTHTYATLAVDADIYEQLRADLLNVNYDHAVDDDEKVIDMHGIALVKNDSFSWFFRDLLTWFMVSDPWPESIPVERTRIENALDQMARARGFDHWIDAFQRYNPPQN
jgi:hypothetical protein